MIRIVDSIWGNILHCWEIAAEVYMVEAIRPPNECCPIALTNGGIMIPTVAATSLLSEKAIGYGERGMQTQKCDIDGISGFTEREYLHYERDKLRLIPLYELLSRRIITDYEVIREFSEYDVLNEGRFALPEFFGEFIFPFTLFMRSLEHKRLENGIWAFRTDKGAGLAVHTKVANYSLSTPAIMYAKQYANSYIFWGSAAAIALRELMKCYPSIRLLIPDDTELEDCVHSQYGCYLSLLGMKNEFDDEMEAM